MIVRALFLVNPILLGLPLGLPHQQKGYPGLLHDLTKNTKRDVMEIPVLLWNHSKHCHVNVISMDTSGLTDFQSLEKYAR